MLLGLHAHAQQVWLPLDPAQSNITIADTSAAYFLFPDVTGEPTSPGSHAASLAGTLSLHWTLGTLSVNSGSKITPIDAQSLLPGIPLPPGGTASTVPAPASLATTYPDLFAPGAALQVALRGASFALQTTSAKPLTAGGFTTDSLTIGPSPGEAHLNLGNPAFTLLNTIAPVSTSPAPNGTLSRSGTTLSLTLPLHFTLHVFGAVSTQTTYHAILHAQVLLEPVSDINRDTAIDVQDLQLLLQSLGCTPDTALAPLADLNDDGRIDALDLARQLSSHSAP